MTFAMCYLGSDSVPQNIAGCYVLWRKIAQMHLFISSFIWKYKTGTMTTFLFMDHRMEILWFVLHVFPSNTVISMWLPNSAIIFTAEVWAIIKALEQIKDSIASKYVIFTDSLSCLQAIYEAGTSLDLDGNRKVSFLIFAKTITFFWGGTQPYWH